MQLLRLTMQMMRSMQMLVSRKERAGNETTDDLIGGHDFLVTGSKVYDAS